MTKKAQILRIDSEPYELDDTDDINDETYESLLLPSAYNGRGRSKGTGSGADVTVVRGIRGWTTWSIVATAVAVVLASLYRAREHSGPIEVTKAAQGEPTTWVVITSINDPTDAIERVCNDPMVQGVVVGDLKSPKSWRSGNCIFLDVKAQKKLGYSIIARTPYRAYTRKNIGYLYAIAHGARVVFDTDDDNLVTTPEIAMLPSQEYQWSLLPGGSNRSSLNIYSYFGRPDVWPRGFPLEEYDDHELVSTAPIEGRPLVQQGLANLDPDVDAIYRLTRASTLKNVYFHRVASAVIPRGVFSPFNSQNTYFDYDAFWGLMIPTTTAFRVCDIWRGYFTQRLLWEIDGVVGFTPPTVDQVRNAHNYLDDFIDELELYQDAGRLTAHLAQWRCRNPELKHCMLDLAGSMASHGFWEVAEVDYYARWIRDLDAIGYQWPAALQHSSITPPIKAPRSSDVTLIVAFNNPLNSADHLDYLAGVYKPHFHQIIFLLPSVEGITEAMTRRMHVEVCHDNPGGFFMFGCLAKIMKAYKCRPETGYFFVGDDSILDYNLLAKADLTRSMAISPDSAGFPAFSDIFDWNWWDETLNYPRPYQGSYPIGLPAIRSALKALPPKWRNTTLWVAKADEGYIHSNDVEAFIELAAHFRKHNVFNEIAYETILHLIMIYKDVEFSTLTHEENRPVETIITYCRNIQQATNKVLTFHSIKTGSNETMRALLTYCHSGCSGEPDCPAQYQMARNTA